MPKQTRLYPAACKGYTDLVALRNSASSFGDDPLEKENHSAAAELFDAQDRKVGRKRARFSASQLQEIRSVPVPIEFEVPGVERTMPLHVGSIKPAHPCDELSIRLDAASIEHVVLFIRNEGIDLDALTTKRAYASVETAGVVRNGSAGLLMRLKPEDAGFDDAPTKKYRTSKIGTVAGWLVPAAADEAPRDSESPVRELVPLEDSTTD